MCVPYTRRLLIALALSPLFLPHNHQYPKDPISVNQVQRRERVASPFVCFYSNHPLESNRAAIAPTRRHPHTRLVCVSAGGCDAFSFPFLSVPCLRCDPLLLTLLPFSSRRLLEKRSPPHWRQRGVAAPSFVSVLCCSLSRLVLKTPCARHY